MPKRRLLAGVLLSTALLVPAGAGASKAAHGKRLSTFGEIEAIAMDGPLVAYDVGARGNVQSGCNRVMVWNVKTGAQRKISGKATCQADQTSTGAGVAELAIAGHRAAWIVNQGGNTEMSDSLYTSTWSSRKERRLATADRFGDVGGPMKGTWIGGLAGSGSLLAVNRWSTDAAGTVTSGKLLRVRRGLSKIASGSDTITARSVDSGRIAVIRTGGDVAVYSRSGHVVHTFSPGPLRDAVLEKTRLLVLTQANKLEVYALKTGKLLHAWHAKGTWTRPGRVGSETRLGAYKNVAVYSSRSKIYALNLSTGKNVLLVQAPRTLEPLTNPRPRLTIERAGVVYAYDTFNHKSLTFHGNVAFVPMAKVHAKVR